MLRPTFKDGVIDARFTKAETTAARKLLIELYTMANMRPIRKELAEAAVAAETALEIVLKLAGNDAPETLPLFDVNAETNTAAE